jgi:leucyl aminopeptidase
VLVGKGVCFDTGGLDLKGADGMRNMKKDMVARRTLALAGLVMARKLPVRLSLLVPAVENAVGPNALRPGEVVITRAGISVEVDNTDAEGRLILCDALARAGELQADAILDFATLTGAARVALGPDMPALFANDDTLANAWQSAGDAVRDPVWRMPLWRPYLRYLNSHVADLANAGSRMAGAVTAALYLERFTWIWTPTRGPMPTAPATPPAARRSACVPGHAEATLRPMSVAAPTVLVLPGWQNSGPEHWQSRWQAAHPHWRRVEQADWLHPRRRLGGHARRRRGSRAGQLVLLAHSLAA